MPALFFAPPVAPIPFDWVKPNVSLIALDATINGKSGFRVTLDTGNAQTMALSQATATSLGLPSRERTSSSHAFAVGSGAPIKMWDTDPITLQIGDVVTKDLKVEVSDYVDHLASTLKAKIDANLGYGYLKAYTVTIDYAHKNLQLDHASLGVGTPFHVGSHPVIIVQAFLNGSGPYRFILDTGASKSVVSPALAQKAQLTLGPEVHMLGAAGLTTAHVATGVTLNVAGKKKAGMTAIVADFVDAMSKSLGEEISGVVGFDFFGDGKLTIDYPDSVLAIE